LGLAICGTALIRSQEAGSVDSLDDVLKDLSTEDEIMQKSGRRFLAGVYVCLLWSCWVEMLSFCFSLSFLFTLHSICSSGRPLTTQSSS
jgi:hypothetical protein